MIYATPFDPVTLEALGQSTNSGFESLEQVKEMLGPPNTDNKRSLIYDGIAYSDFAFRIDEPGISA